MNKLISFILIGVALFSCKKTEFSPKGPTDVRVENISDQTLKELTVDIDGEEAIYGTLNPGGISDYNRFEIAYPKIKISAKVQDVMFSTGEVDYTYQNYLGQIRVTYVIWISDWPNKKLEITNVIPEEELELK